MTAHASTVTYLDVIEAVLGHLPGQKLHADNAAWHRAWKMAAESDPGREFLGELWFETRDPFPPFSAEVQTSRHLFQRAGMLSLGNPKYHYFTVEKSAQDEAKAASARRFGDREEAIKQLAAVVWRELGEDESEAEDS